MRRCRAVVIAFFTLCLSVTAQQTRELESGLKPFGSYEGGNLDSVSLTSGNVMVHIPLISYPQRGGMLRVNYLLRLNSKSWYQKFIPLDIPSGGFWRWAWGAKGEEYGLTLVLDQPLTLKSDTQDDPNDPNDPVYNILHAITPDGASHSMEPTKCSADCTFDTPLEYQSIDATAIKAEGIPQTGGGEVTLTDRSGIRHTMGTSSIAGLYKPMRVEDPNGNFITISYTLSNPQLKMLVTDTLGRTLGTVTTTSTASCPSGTNSATNVAFPGFQGASADMIFCYTNISVSSGFACGCGVQESMVVIAPFLTAVVLPTQPQTKWLFSYLPSGEISSITLPTGGTISYQWQVRTTPTTASRWLQFRTVDDGTGPKTWEYIWGPLNASPVTHVVKDPPDASGTRNEHAHKFSQVGEEYFETRVQHYAGSVSTGTLLQTINTAYDGSGNGSWTGGSKNVVPRKITTIWPSGKVSEVQKDYDIGAFSQWLGTNLTFGNVVEERAYDFGQNTPGVVDLSPPNLGPLLVKTKTEYRAFDTDSGATAYKNSNLVDLVSRVTACGPTQACNATDSATFSSQSKYGYDETSPTAFTPTPSTLNTSPPGPRGNQTSMSRWVDKRTPPGFVISTSAYFNTGMVKSVLDPLGHSANFDYSPTFWGAYLTQTTNALSQTTSSDYDFNTGLLKSTTDANGVVTKFVSYDSVLRLTQKKLAFGTPSEAQIDYLYTDTIPAKVKVSVPVAGTTKIETEAEVDELGRTRVTRLLSDPQGTVFTRIQYDNLGRKLKVWNPARCDLDVASPSCSGDATFGITTYDYDGLGRITKVIPPDGTSSTNNVSTNFDNFPTAEVTDQQGKKRRTTTDALGRIIQVDEPGVQP